jgi:hypothetical protein
VPVGVPLRAEELLDFVAPPATAEPGLYLVIGNFSVVFSGVCFTAPSGDVYSLPVEGCLLGDVVV